jgi:hypothetical protein
MARPEETNGHNFGVRVTTTVTANVKGAAKAAMLLQNVAATITKCLDVTVSSRKTIENSNAGKERAELVRHSALSCAAFPSLTSATTNPPTASLLESAYPITIATEVACTFLSIRHRSLPVTLHADHSSPSQSNLCPSTAGEPCVALLYHWQTPAVTMTKVSCAWRTLSMSPGIADDRSSTGYVSSAVAPVSCGFLFYSVQCLPRQ